MEILVCFFIFSILFFFLETKYSFHLDHLTSFALLLDSGSGSEGYVIAWLSLGFVCVGIIAILIAIILIEVKYTVKQRKMHSTLRAISSMSDKPELSSGRSANL